MKVLVTGSMGYLGTVLGKYLTDNCPDWLLVGVDVGFYKNCLNEKRSWESFYKETRAKDIRRLEVEDLREVDAIVHLAAISNDPMGKEFEMATTDINYEASLRLAQIAKEAGVESFVFASSCSMYGAGGGTPRKEGSSLNPLTAYARSKVAVENELPALADSSFKVTSLRFATACGVSPCMRLDLVLNDFVATAMSTGKIEVLSDGTPWRPLIHTQDMCAAIQWAIQRKGDSLISVNVGSDEWTWQIGDLAHQVGKILGDVEVQINRSAEPDKRSYRVDFSYFRALAPDFQPKVDFAEAVRELKKEVMLLNYEGKDIRHSQYIRLEVLRKLRKTGLIDSSLFMRGV